MARSELDHGGSVPLYVQLAEILREQIKTGEIPAGHIVPSMKTLREEHGCSRGTVTRATAILKKAGLIYASPGKGFFVTKRAEGLAPAASGWAPRPQAGTAGNGCHAVT